MQLRSCSFNYYTPSDCSSISKKLFGLSMISFFLNLACFWSGMLPIACFICCNMMRLKTLLVTEKSNLTPCSCCSLQRVTIYRQLNNDSFQTSGMSPLTHFIFEDTLQCLGYFLSFCFQYHGPYPILSRHFSELHFLLQFAWTYFCLKVLICPTNVGEYQWGLVG